MKKLIAAVLLAVALSGCGIADRIVAKVTGDSTVCVDGVAYIQFTSGASVKYTPEGKIATCK